MQAATAENDDEGSTAPSAKPRFNKRLIIIGAAVIALLLGGGGAAFFFLGRPAASESAHAEAEAADESGHEGGGEAEAASFVDVPPLVLNLRSADGAPRFLKLRFMIVAADPTAAEAVKTQLPLLIDAYQPFLRELRPEDLAGSAAVFRIKEEMLIRATATLGAGKVKDVLIQDLIQQ